MSTSFAVFDSLTTSGLSFITISIPMLTALRSLILILPPNFRPLSSVNTSSGTIHFTSSVVCPFMIVSKSIFCFAQVMMKFVSSRIFIVWNKLRLCCWLLVFGFWFLVFDFSWC